jgi:hypothetical protein
MTIHRWLNWKPPILEGSSTPDPAKPAKPSSAGFDGSALGPLSKIEDAPDAERPVNAANCASEPEPQILEGGATPDPAKPAKPGFAGFAGFIMERPSKIEDASESQAVPQFEASDAERLAALEPTIGEFRKHFDINVVRVAGPKDRGIPYTEWRARKLNRIFAERGSGGVGRITVATVREGLEKEANEEPAKPAKPHFGHKDGVADD